MAWLTNVAAYEIITSAHINNIKNSVSTWLGDVSAAGYNLSNVGKVLVNTSTDNGVDQVQVNGSVLATTLKGNIDWSYVQNKPSIGIGATGPKGATGFTGATGPTGQTGPIGYTGATGVGYIGATGVGFAGATGSQGLPGATGPANGPVGATGFTGATGTAGTGFPGATGPAGAAGPIGATGLRGSTGFTGATGTAGTGFPGASGPAGAAGPIGATGFAGSTGPGGYRTIGIVIDGGGSVISTGSKGFISVPFAGTIDQWTVYADQSGSAVVDIKRSTYSGFPTTTSIVGAGNKPTLSSVQKNQSSPTSWTSTSIAAGDALEFYVDSVATVTRVNIALRVIV